MSEERQIVCPKCGFDFVHIDVVRMLARPLGDGGPIQNVSVDLGGEITQFRQEHDPYRYGDRHTVVLAGECENGCDFEIHLRQHEGHTMMSIV